MKLSQKDKRTIKLGIFCAVGIVILVFTMDWFKHWSQVRKSLTAAKAQLKVICPTEAKREGLLTIVPVFQMPQSQEKQKFLFREKFNEQLKKAGVKGEPLQILPVSKSKRLSGYKLLRLRFRRGKCKLGQVLDLLAALKENPYLVGIEEFTIKKSDPKKPQELELDLTVATFVK